MAKKKYTKSREIFGCMMCPFTCYDVERQAEHYVDEHSGRPKEAKPGGAPVTCEFCLEGFRTEEGLDHHKQITHQKTLL